MESVHWHPPVLSITNSGSRPGGSVSALKQMQQNYSGRSLKIYAICVQVREKAVEKHCGARCQLPGVLQVWKSSTIMHCCTQLSEAFLNDCFAWSCSTEAPRHKWLPPASCHHMTWNILWRLHKSSQKKLNVYFLKVSSVRVVFLLAVAMIVSSFNIKFGLLWHLEKRDKQERPGSWAIKNVFAVKNSLVQDIALPVFCRRICFFASGSDLWSIVRMSTE